MYFNEKKRAEAESNAFCISWEGKGCLCLTFLICSPTTTIIMIMIIIIANDINWGKRH